jgi:tripartite-type tricarboxylate transporter receptor subunit TctC
MATRRHLLLAPPALLAARAAAAQGDPWRIVANFPPGGALDGCARLVADHAMRERRSPAVVENRPGAGGNIGAAAVARARPDGRTLLATIDTTLSVNPHLYRSLGFDPAELVPVAVIGAFALVLLVHPAAPYSDLRGFLAAARREPVFYSSAGSGSPGHLAMEHLRQVAGLPAGALENVPQRGNAEAITALVAGTAPAGFLAMGGGPELVRAGRLKPIAVSGAARHPALPDVPTVAESGFPGFEVRIANLLMAPRGTPDAVVAEWSALASAALGGEAAQARFAAWGLDPGSLGDAAAAGAFLGAASARWARVVREAGMRVE